jgi:hypothetical protein
VTLANDSLQRTEIRAGCVIGIIAAILALRLDPKLSSLAQDPILSIIIVYWGIYLGLLAISIENEPFGKKTCSTVRQLSLTVFGMGLILTGLEGILEAVNYVDYIFLRNAIRNASIKILGLPGFGPKVMGLALLGSAYGIFLATLARREERQKWRTNLPTILIILLLAAPLFFI